MQSTGIKHRSSFQYLAKQESSNSSSAINAMKTGSEEKKKKESTTQPLTSPPPHEVGWGENQKGGNEELRYLV